MSRIGESTVVEPLIIVALRDKDKGVRQAGAILLPSRHAPNRLEIQLAQTKEAKKRITLSGFDALAHVGEKVGLRAKLESSHLRRDIENKVVEFYVDGIFVGRSKTDDEGFAYLPFTPEKEGNFEIRCTTLKPILQMA